MQRGTHVELVTGVRRSYRKKNLAKSDPADYLSLAIDGADQKNYSLPNFCTHTKDE